MSQVNIENLEVNKTLPVITCDYEGLKEWALAYVSRYKDLLVTEDQVKDIKKDMAEINKAKQNLERARIDAVKAVSAPIKAFEAKIKEIAGIFDNAYNALGNQVKEYESAAREAKRIEIQSTIDRQIADFIGKHPDMEDKIAVPIPDKWLNKTCHMKDIGNEIARLVMEQYAEEQERQRIERAQAERRLLIENAVKAANEKYKTDLPLYPFMEPYYTDLEKDAADIVAIIEREAKDHSEMVKAVADRNLEKPNLPGNEAISVAPAHNISNVKINDIPLQLEPQKAQNLIMFRFTALFTPEHEDRVREILNQNHFMKIVRQLQGIGVDVEFSKMSANE